MKTLLLMRHGKAAWPEGFPDHARPLAPRGREAAPLMALHLREQGLVPDLILVSDARRTRETYSVMASVFPDSGSRLEPRLYEATSMRLLGILREIDSDIDTVMVIAHNPGLHEAALMLADHQQSEGSAMARLCDKVPTAAVSVLRSDSHWANWVPEVAMLTHFFTPKMLGGVDED